MDTLFAYPSLSYLIAVSSTHGLAYTVNSTTLLCRLNRTINVSTIKTKQITPHLLSRQKVEEKRSKVFSSPNRLSVFAKHAEVDANIVNTICSKTVRTHNSDASTKPPPVYIKNVQKFSNFVSLLLIILDSTEFIRFYPRPLILPSTRNSGNIFNLANDSLRRK